MHGRAEIEQNSISEIQIIRNKKTKNNNNIKRNQNQKKNPANLEPCNGCGIFHFRKD